MFKNNFSKIQLLIALLIFDEAFMITWNYDSTSQLNWSLDCDFTNNDLSSVKTSGEYCGKTCRQTKDCTHFSWNNFEGGTCWMKKGAISLSNAFVASGLVCGVLDTISWNYDATNKLSWSSGCDFTNNDLSSAKTSGEMCGYTCRMTSGCTHFSWTNFEGGTCWMKKGLVLKSNAFISSGVVCGILDPTSSTTGINDLKGSLLWSDEFDSSSKFGVNWIQETGGNGWGNNELQYYTNNNQNTEIRNGMLTIHTRKELKDSNRFTSARLRSSKKFRYGVFEMRAKLPQGRGTWPAFWLLASKRPLNWPADGEIDIMEHVGYDPNVIHATIHCSTYNHVLGTQIGKSTWVNDVFNQFHLYQLYWSDKSIRGYVDGNLYFRYDRPVDSNANNWPFDNEFDIIVNTAVGGNWGGGLGVDENIWPQKYIIDYVRVWNLK